MVSYYLFTTICGLAKILAYNPPTPNAVPRALSNALGAAGSSGVTVPSPATCPKPAPYCCNLCCGSKAAACAACWSAVNCACVIPCLNDPKPPRACISAALLDAKKLDKPVWNPAWPNCCPDKPCSAPENCCCAPAKPNWLANAWCAAACRSHW